MPEIAIVGRSNVGKSSLLNFIAGIKSLAKVANTPGKTRSINFFNVDDKFYLVDLPGFGYSKMSKGEDLKIKNLITKYLNNNENLKTIIHLIDSRHSNLKIDKVMNEFLNSLNYNYFIILTKSDKIKRNERKLAVKLLKENLALQENVKIIFSSTLEKEGKNEIQQLITNIISDRID